MSGIHAQTQFGTRQDERLSAYATLSSQIASLPAVPTLRVFPHAQGARAAYQASTLGTEAKPCPESGARMPTRVVGANSLATIAAARSDTVDREPAPGIGENDIDGVLFQFWQCGVAPHVLK